MITLRDRLRFKGEARMGQPVVHFEIAGKDAAKLQSFYSELFDWKVNVNETMGYGVVETGGEG